MINVDWLYLLQTSACICGIILLVALTFLIVSLILYAIERFRKMDFISAESLRNHLGGLRSRHSGCDDAEKYDIMIYQVEKIIDDMLLHDGY